MENRFISVPVAAAVVMRKDGKYVMIQEKKPETLGLWCIPAGRVNVGETLEQTAVREAKEESGFDVKLTRKLGLYQDLASEPPKHVYEGEIVGGSLAYPEDEIMDAKLMTLDEIKNIERQLRGSWIIDAISIVESANNTNK